MASGFFGSPKAATQHPRNGQGVGCPLRCGLQHLVSGYRGTRAAVNRVQQRLAHNHLCGSKCQHRSADVDDHRKAFDQFEHHRAAKHHDGHADQQPDDDEVKRAMCRTRHAQHVVDAHQRVGHHNRFHGAPKSADHRALMLAVVLVGQQFVGNPQQSDTADQHQPWYFEQPDHAHRHGGTHDDGSNGAPHDGFFLQMRRQAARGQRNHDGVVASKHQINQNDRQQGRPPGGCKKFHRQLSIQVATRATAGRCRLSTRRWATRLSVNLQNFAM